MDDEWQTRGKGTRVARENREEESQSRVGDERQREMVVLVRRCSQSRRRYGAGHQSSCGQGTFPLNSCSFYAVLTCRKGYHQICYRIIYRASTWNARSSHRQGRWPDFLFTRSPNHRISVHTPLLLSKYIHRCPTPRWPHHSNLQSVTAIDVSRQINPDQRQTCEPHLHGCVPHRLLRRILPYGNPFPLRYRAIY